MQDVLEAALAMQSAKDLSTISTLTEKFIQRHDFTRFGVSYVRDDTLASSEIVPASNIPDDFLRHYADNDYFLLDPLAQLCMKTSTPFIWEEVLALRDQPPIVKRIYSEATEWGMGNGMSVPINSFNGLRGSVTFAGERSKFGPREKMELHMLALVLHARVAELCQDMISTCGPALRLTEREQETLKWGALGKTSEDIAGIMGVTKRTVDQHFENAGKKLGTFNRVHTVVKAFRQSLITL